MLKQIVAFEIERQFPDMGIEWGGESGDLIATIAPAHHSWTEISVCEDGEEIIIFYGDFTHVHYGCYDDNLPEAIRAQTIAQDICKELSLVFNDQVEFFRVAYFGAGGMRRRGSQGKLSRILFGRNGILWSGRHSK